MSASREAQRVLDRAAIVAPPVPVDSIARTLGARIVLQPFEDDVAGLLYREGPRVVIAVKSSDPITRRRFTIAHEVGHLRLHPGRPMIVDKFLQLGNRRDARSSLATDREEIEANTFAAHLLMPEEMVRA